MEEKMKKVRNYCNIVDAIGNTPIVKLSKITEGVKSDVFAKLEFMNPMGSIKDRIAKYMIEKAEADGRIIKGQLIIENSSGNTALGLALIAVQKGYRLKVIIRDNLCKEKIDLLKALQAEIVKIDNNIPSESPDSYSNITPKIVAKTKNCYFPDQHNNRENNEAHYLTTGPEIWEQMDGQIDYFIAGMGTGGTIEGVARYLKEMNNNIKVIGVDVVGSVFYHFFRTGKLIKSDHYLLEGIGDVSLGGCVDFSNIDDIYQVTDKESFLHTRMLVQKEGILGGGSSGAVLCAILKLARSMNKSARIVTIFPDSASRYLSTIFNDEWMKNNGFLDE